MSRPPGQSYSYPKFTLRQIWYNYSKGSSFLLYRRGQGGALPLLFQGEMVSETVRLPAYESTRRRYRDIAIRFYEMKQPVALIAVELGCSPATVWRALAPGKMMLDAEKAVLIEMGLTL